MTTHALLNLNIADANRALLKSCERTIRVSTYYWHEAVWSVGLLLSISSAFIDRWVELLMISCVYLNILTIEALFPLSSFWHCMLYWWLWSSAIIWENLFTKLSLKPSWKPRVGLWRPSGHVYTKEKPHHPWLLNVSSHSPTGWRRTAQTFISNGLL